MVVIKATFTGVDELIRDNTTATTGLPYKIMAAGRQKLFDTAQANLQATTTTRTGELLRSQRADPLSVSGSTISTAVEFTAEHAPYVHDGTRPHPIYPRKARVLSFVMPGVGRVFAAMVNHPGGKPHPFLKDAADELERGFTGGIPTWY